MATFHRAGFPVPAQRFPIDLSFSLRRFDLDVVGDFLLIELPDHETELGARPRDAPLGLLPARSRPTPLPPRRLPGSDDTEPRRPVRRDRRPRDLALEGGPRVTLRRPPAAQITGTTVFPVYPPVGDSMRAYDVKVPGIRDERRPSRASTRYAPRARAASRRTSPPAVTSSDSSASTSSSPRRWRPTPRSCRRARSCPTRSCRRRPAGGRRPPRGGPRSRTRSPPKCSRSSTSATTPACGSWPGCSSRRPTPTASGRSSTSPSSR